MAIRFDSLASDASFFFIPKRLMKHAVFLLGAPGSGKGTFADAFVRETQCERISTGECFREAMHNPSHPHFEEIRHYMEQADYVPDDVTLKVVDQTTHDFPDGVTILFDGFPRTLFQAEQFDLPRPDLNIAGVLWLDVPEAELIERLSGRRICLACQAIYHIHLFPPSRETLCDHCSTPLSQRYDDTAEHIPNRIAAYLERSQPVVDYYRQRNRLIRIDGRQPPHACIASSLNALDSSGL